MIYDAQGNQYRQMRPIGFHGHDQSEDDPRVELRSERGSLPDWVSMERSDEAVAARGSKRV